MMKLYALLLALLAATNFAYASVDVEHDINANDLGLKEVVSPPEEMSPPMDLSASADEEVGEPGASHGLVMLRGSANRDRDRNLRVPLLIPEEEDPWSYDHKGSYDGYDDQVTDDKWIRNPVTGKYGWGADMHICRFCKDDDDITRRYRYEPWLEGCSEDYDKCWFKDVGPQSKIEKMACTSSPWLCCCYW